MIEQEEEIQFDDEELTNGHSAILTVFNDILQSIKKNIVDELGDRSYSLFEESKSKLTGDTRELFKNYHPDVHKNANLQAINAALKNLDLVIIKKSF